MSVRGERTELTDILLSGATIDPDIREDVRLLYIDSALHTVGQSLSDYSTCIVVNLLIV